MGRNGLDSSGSEYVRMTKSCQKGDEVSSSRIARNFLTISANVSSSVEIISHNYLNIWDSFNDIGCKDVELIQLVQNRIVYCDQMKRIMEFRFL
jgi:hypothetical protein